jgi:hypothetical protein
MAAIPPSGGIPSSPSLPTQQPQGTPGLNPANIPPFNSQDQFARQGASGGCGGP